ncbi:sulfotransferase domain-containing protein [Flavimaricola marinus]|uniref:Uncharacterized protein n=1 Tax=Flavimaricola marinus TaxID=1819565 RepID=A0A238LHM3_9RHOB|nr:sulfotransferase domain-containing protein [Flavimaricola marinus]SMY09151.1 hypothetical protein LOM8899_03313 [Flavimaricola marinus]
MMQSPRKITFASPAEPSGASWLINCLIELGIRVDHRPATTKLWRGRADATFWRQDGDRFSLDPRAEVMGKWIPALVMHDSFHFRTDVIVDYRQDLPLRTDDLGTVILFLRDPRDALYSMFRRQSPDLSFEEHCNLPNPATLLPAPDHWLLHAESWRALAGGRVYLFKAYKTDATALLSRILGDLDLHYTPDQVDAAVAASGIEQARAAEALYKARNPGDIEVANRAGLVGDWRNYGEGASTIARIEARCGGIMQALGMQTDTAVSDAPLGAAQSRYLRLYDRMIRPAILGAPSGDDGSFDYVKRVIAQISREQLIRSKRPDADCLQLTQSLAEFATAAGLPPQPHLAEIGDHFRPGRTGHMSTVAELMRKRRAAQAK